MTDQLDPPARQPASPVERWLLQKEDDDAAETGGH